MTSPRTGSDRCPGLLRPHLAADGALVRLRVPGGVLGVEVVTDLIAAGRDFGAPVIQLTSRANLQLRGLPDPLPAPFVERVQATGLFPSSTHERVRNIVAAPLTPALAGLVAELDAALCADPELSALSGRFLWAISDVGGSALDTPWDMAFQQLTPRHGLLLVGDQGLETSCDDAVGHLVERARVFLRSRTSPSVWNVRDLPPDSPVFAGLTPTTPRVAAPLYPGAIGNDLVVGVPLGTLRSHHVEALSRATATVVLTPWHSLVVRDGAPAAPQLGAAGLVVTPDSAWTRLSACVGAPSCSHTSSPTLNLTTAAAARLAPGRARVHVVGCGRQCGRPRSAHTLVVAPQDVEAIVAAAGETA